MGVTTLIWCVMLVFYILFNTYTWKCNFDLSKYNFVSDQSKTHKSTTSR